jgi:uncharacterized protein (TIGR02680 family)
VTTVSGNGQQSAPAAEGLPVPGRARWQPLRAGLVNLYHYDYEEFWFRDGRLLLRGNNGAGKSKVLALMLPFLLDGEVSSHRVEPDGDPAKRMEWNLLLDRYEERLGYTWLELGRLDERGRPEYLTLGCGMKAVRGRGIAARWLFHTGMRVGLELWLATPARTPLTRDRLIEALGEHGQVHDRVDPYRHAVDERLFHLGHDRYETLVTLLIQLRQPQLSKRPDEKRLSAALTEALAPIDQAVLHDVAAAFHDLEQQRDELRGLAETRREVDGFLDRYRRYAEVAARREAAEVRGAQSAYESTNRGLSAVRAEREQAEEAERASSARLRQLEERELPAARAAEQELVGRPELKDLARAEKAASAARDAATQATNRRAEADEQLEHAQEERRRLEADTGATREAVERAAATAGSAGDQAGIGREHAELLAPLKLPDGTAPDGQAPDAPAEIPPGVHQMALDAATRQARELADRRDQAVRHVQELVTQADQARDRLTGARRRYDEAIGARDNAAARRIEAEEAVAAAGAALAGEWCAFAGSAMELPLPDPDTFLPELALWAETLHGPDPARAVAEAAGTEARNALAEARAAARTRVRAAQDELGPLRKERDRLEGGEHETPPAPHTRPADVRDGRPGAPLWQLIDFRDGTPASDRAGLEAALEAAGLLDAWVTPEGRLLDPDTLDVVVTAGPPADRNLGAVLRPAIDHADPQAGTVSEGTVQALLAGIGLGAGTDGSWVDVSGRWRLGVVDGRWSKPSARFIGRGAREAARRQRLAELAEEITLAEGVLLAAETEAAAFEARQRTLQAELGRIPDGQALRDAHGDAHRAAEMLRRLERAVTEQETALAQAEAKAVAAGQARDQAAADLRVPASAAQLDALRNTVGAYRTAVASLWPEIRGHTNQLRALTSAQKLIESAARAAAARAEEAAAAETAAFEAESSRDTLRSAIGAAVADLEAQLATTREQIKALERVRRKVGLEQRAHLEQAARARGQEQELSAKLAGEAARRGETAVAFQRFAATGLLATAVPELELPDPTGGAWAPDPTVRLARRVEQALERVGAGDSAWERLQQDIARSFQGLAEALSRNGHHAAAELSSGRFVVSIRYQGMERDPAALAELLAEELENRERLLDAKERQVLEEHLVNEVASHLQELISDAEAQVGRMNAELDERPTSTGMRLRLHWELRPDAPAGLPAARARLLRQDADAWSLEDRAAVGGFLQEQISAERARNETGTWLEHLAAAFDYRAWHHFRIQRLQDGRWRPATGPASGGERALTATLPLFAAASGHYRSAHPAAPRLVLLDEAFAGIDDRNRAECMGLLATFDLDFVMTSEREWGCYPTLPGLAIHHLTRRDGIDAVHITRWEWDGRARDRVDPAIPPLLAPAAGSPAGNGQGSGRGEPAPLR